jgi:hypothetical protein
MRCNGLSCLNDIRNIRLTILIQRGWDTDHNRFDFPDATKVRRSGETPGVYLFPYCLALNVLYVALTGVARFNLCRVDIESNYHNTRTRKLQTEWQANITQANDRDSHLSL